jgi:hypothetical protein
VVAGLPDYGVKQQINTIFDPTGLNLSIGILSLFSPSVWSWFVGRLGRVCWTLKVEKDAGNIREQLEKVLVECTPQVVFLDEGIRLRPTSPLWKRREIQVVVSVENWKGKPPKDWWHTASQEFSHEDLGGVTNGIFKIHFATSPSLGATIESDRGPALRAKLSHILDHTEKGTRCPIPKGKEAPLGQNAMGLLHWERRLYNIESPTVYSRTYWVRRRLSPKELCSVLDLPRSALENKSNGEQLRHVNVPGKVRSQVVSNMRKGFQRVLKKRKGLSRTSAEEARVSKQVRWKLPGDEDLEENGASHANTMACRDTVTIKSTKADDASVPAHLWNNRCLERNIASHLPLDVVIKALDVLRDRFCLKYWKRKVARDFWNWIKQCDKEAWFESAKERSCSIQAGCKAINYAIDATWWEWDGGSYPFFWRWKKEFVREMRDGIPPRFTRTPPVCRERQRPNSNPLFAAKERAKVLKVLKRGYLQPVQYSKDQSLMHYFSVPKGEDDIRMVYDGSKCGLNGVTFAPWFAVPTSSTLERTVMPHTVQGDNDFGDMFLNFQLHNDLQRFTGVDASDLLHDDGAVSWLKQVNYDCADGVIFTWDRPAMGLTGSPYQAVQTATRGKQVILGDRKDRSNPFRWDTVELNLPGSVAYNPTLPWIFKRRTEDNRIAADLHTYIDDNRVTANDEGEAWNASSRIAKCCAWLGMQDAARKRRAPSMTPGAWAGTIIRTDGIIVERMVSQERWDKTRDKIRWIRDHLIGRPVSSKGFKIPHKPLESIRGFLVYVTRTYPEMTPYLKGIHLTLDSWRTGRTKSGWKEGVAHEDMVDEEDDEGCELTNVVDDKILPLELRMTYGSLKPPAYVYAVPRLKQDVDSLARLTSLETPPAILVRPVEVMVGYLVGDASGSGHGSSFLYTKDETLNLAHGTWSKEASQRSSNFRELANLVRRMEELSEQGVLVRGTELFVFTDNFVTESVFYKGAASSPYLHSLIERLKKLQLQAGLFVHVLWIAGTRMIEQGTDGLSRGDFNTGIMAGKDFLSLIPLAESAVDLSPELVNWVRKGLPSRLEWEVLSPEDWFSKGHEDGFHIWAPAPAVADVVLEQMCESVLIRPWNAHVFLCPAHMTYKWRKQLRKVSDLVVTIPVGGELWPSRLHEPLIFALTCPLLAYSPWRVKYTQRLVGGQSPMPKVWSKNWEVEGNILRELWIHEVPTDPKLLWGMASRMLHEGRVRSVPGTTS